MANTTTIETTLKLDPTQVKLVQAAMLLETAEEIQAMHPGEFKASAAHLAAKAERLLDVVNGPKIVCLCGSSKFFFEFQKVNYELTMLGEIVLSIGFYPHSTSQAGHGEGIGHDSLQKIALDELHKRKIDLADYVYVINKGGYIGESTRGEIKYAENLGKAVIYMEEVRTQ